MTAPTKIPNAQLTAGDFAKNVKSEDLIYFVLNVGDGDAQVLALPEEPTLGGQPRRRIIVVDAAIVSKIPKLLESLEAAGLMGPGHTSFVPGSVALVVATHPHDDHIGGMADLVQKYRDSITEFWDSGYFHPSGAYHNLMTEIERSPFLVYAHPSSGLQRWFGNLGVTVLSPSIQLKNRYDTYGIDPNDSSISLKLDYPTSRVQQRKNNRSYVDLGAARQSLVLGADAQTLSWSYVLTEFPQLDLSDSEVAGALDIATGKNDPLKAKVLKVSHDASKHGVNIELVERIHPSVMLVSSVGGGGKYGFPHSVAQEILREAIEEIAKNQTARSPDWKLHLFYTCDEDDAGSCLGSIAIIMGSNQRREIWRFGDAPGDAVNLRNGRKLS